MAPKLSSSHFKSCTKTLLAFGNVFLTTTHKKRILFLCLLSCKLLLYDFNVDSLGSNNPQNIQLALFIKDQFTTNVVSRLHKERMKILLGGFSDQNN